MIGKTIQANRAATVSMTSLLALVELRIWFTSRSEMQRLPVDVGKSAEETYLLDTGEHQLEFQRPTQKV